MSTTASGSTAPTANSSPRGRPCRNTLAAFVGLCHPHAARRPHRKRSRAGQGRGHAGRRLRRRGRDRRASAQPATASTAAGVMLSTGAGGGAWPRSAPYYSRSSSARHPPSERRLVPRSESTTLTPYRARSPPLGGRRRMRQPRHRLVFRPPALADSHPFRRNGRSAPSLFRLPATQRWVN
jgi:hypothetical protein